MALVPAHLAAAKTQLTSDRKEIKALAKVVEAQVTQATKPEWEQLVAAHEKYQAKLKDVLGQREVASKVDEIKKYEAKVADTLKRLLQGFEAAKKAILNGPQSAGEKQEAIARLTKNLQDTVLTPEEHRKLKEIKKLLASCSE